MKIRVLLVTLMAALVALSFSHIQAAQAEEETELGSRMEKMGDAFRALRRQIGDPGRNQDSMARLAEIRDNAQAALKLVPAKRDEIPAAEQARFLANYQAKMKDFIDIVVRTEEALKSGKNDEAARLVGVMADTQKQGHRDFQKKKKKNGS